MSLRFKRLAALPPSALVGRYQRDPVENGWHKVEVLLEGSTLLWANEELRWPLVFEGGRLASHESGPYGVDPIEIHLESDGTVSGLSVGGERYRRQ